MRTSTKLIRLGAVVPAGFAGSFVAVMALGFLPDAGLGFAFLGTLALSLVLACGRLEAPAARLFGLARDLRPGERAVLQPGLALVENLDLAPRRVLVRLATGGDLPATPIGRDTVIVEQWLLAGLYERRLRTEDAAAAIGHAVASQRVGPSRFDMAARLWAFPWTLLLMVIRQIARIFSWVPAGGLAWHLRIVVGVVAVVQGFQPGGNPTVGVATGVLVAISYVAPAADRTWQTVVERNADRIVAQRGLADPLIHFARWREGTASMERVHRIRSAASERAWPTPSEPAEARRHPTKRLAHGCYGSSQPRGKQRAWPPTAERRGNIVSDDRTDIASAIERSRYTDPVLAVDYVRQVAREAAEESGHREAAQVVVALRQEYRIMPLKQKEASANRLATWQAVRVETRSLVAMAMGGTADKALFDERVSTPAAQTLPRAPGWAPDPLDLPAASLQLAALRTHRPPLSN